MGAKARAAATERDVLRVQVRRQEDTAESVLAQLRTAEQISSKMAQPHCVRSGRG
jgi:hypothetical protein